MSSHFCVISLAQSCSDFLPSGENELAGEEAGFRRRYQRAGNEQARLTTMEGGGVPLAHGTIWPPDLQPSIDSVVTDF